MVIKFSVGVGIAYDLFLALFDFADTLKFYLVDCLHGQIEGLYIVASYRTIMVPILLYYDGKFLG